MTKSPESQVIPHARNVPMSTIDTYSRFGVGSWAPSEFTGTFDESMSWKQTCFIGDWSPLWKLLVRGKDALRLFSDISVNSFAKFDVGQGKHAIFCNTDGKVMGEGVLKRLGENEFLFTSGPGAPWVQYMFERGEYEATVEDVTPTQFIFQVQGPNALYVLEKAAQESLRDIGFMRFREAKIHGMAVKVLRQGMAGELGYELYGSSEHGLAVYQAILDAGQEYGIRRLGVRTQTVNHVEACFPTSSVDYIPAMHGTETRGFFEMLKKGNYHLNRDIVTNYGSFEVQQNSDLYRSPVQLGWARNIKFDHDFVGRKVLEREVAAPQQTIVTLVWNPEDVIGVYATLFSKGDVLPYMELPRHRSNYGMWADKVLLGDRVVGVSTSRCYSYYFREMISLCTIDVTLAQPGTAVTVVWGTHGGPQKRVRATVQPAPYKHDNRRIDVNTLPSYWQGQTNSSARETRAGA